MTLTHPLIVWGITILALIAMVWAVGWIPRVIRSQPDRERWGWVRSALVQLGTLATVLVLALTAVFAQLNAQFGWFGSWNELIGVRGQQSTQSFGAVPQTPRSAAQPAAAPLGAQQIDPLQVPELTEAIRAAGPDAAVHGVMVDTQLRGPQAGLGPVRVVIYLPPSYFRPENSHQRYPVIFAFSGFPGHPDVFRTQFGFPKPLDELRARKQLADAIVVVPDINPGGIDSECVDATAPGGVRMETFLSSDLVGWVMTNLRTHDDPAAWATAGFSAGGWCAAMLGVRHPERFGNVVALSGYFEPNFTDGQQWTAPDDPAYQLGRIVRDTKPPVHIWFLTGTSDQYAMPSMQRFAPNVAEPTSLTVVTVAAGSHTPSIWQPGLQTGLTWLGSVSSYFAGR